MSHGSLKGKVYKKKFLNPRRLKGVSAFIASFGIYSYLPYIALYSGGTTIPIFAACAAGYYGMIAFNEQETINCIEVIKDGSN